MDDFYNELPEEFSQDDDKWFKWFPPRAFLVLIITTAITLGLTYLFHFIGLQWIGYLIGTPNIIFFTAITMIPVPEDNYLKGAGQKMDVILLRRFIRKRTKCIYIKGYDSGY